MTDFKNIVKAEETVITWGKFKGQKLKELPNGYINWLAAFAFDDSLASKADLIRQWRETYNIHIE